MSYQIPDLPYDYSALEPVISGDIMEIHHKKHHAAYANNLNLAIEQYKNAEAKKDVAAMIATQKAIKFNGGGFVNHNIFWTNLAPQSKGGGEAPTGKFADAINSTFGSLDKLITRFNGMAGPIQGSGWGWLGVCPCSGKLVLATSENQDPLSMQGLVPVLGVDVWEHAYYLQYKNARPEYLKAIWGVINWANVKERYEAVVSSL